MHTEGRVAKMGQKSQQCGDREEKELRQMTSFLDLEKTPFLD